MDTTTADTTDTASGHAGFVGRIGALAVALGIGCAVSAVPAFADAGDPSADTSSAVSAAPARQARPSPGTAGGARRAQPGAPRGAAAKRRANIRGATPIRKPGPRRPQAAPAPSAALSTPVTASVPAAAAGAVVPAAAGAAAPVVLQPAARAAATATRVQPIRAITGLVNSVLAPLLGGGTGGAPGQTPLLFTVLAWARREFGRIATTGSPAAVTTSSQTQSPNLLMNPGAELSTPSGSGFSAVSMPGWAVTGTPTVIGYGTPRVIMPLGIPQALPTLPSIWSFPKAKNGPADGGAQFFGGGNVADSTITQTVDLRAAGTAIDGGGVTYNLGGWLGGYSFDPSHASVKVTFLDADNKALGTGTIGPVTGLQRGFGINLLERSTSGVLPAGTRYAQVDVVFTDKNPIKYGFAAGYNDAFADNISFTIGADLPAPEDPQPVASTPPSLDHFFLLYMENKGYNDIIGSANAPFLNQLIDSYGFAGNYYALTHGSLPNYYPQIGGDNFGITYNCTQPCITATDTLVSNLTTYGKTWKAYAQGLAPGGDPLVATDTYAVDETPFPAFTSIASDPDLGDYMVPLEQMAMDLRSPLTTPNYAWVDPNEANNGEGPIDGLQGILKFALNQIDPKHQYNVPALDAFVADNVTTIMDSNVWNSPDRSVIAVTFDEDNNNLSLGFGNVGNHIVTVLIPNQAAIDAGWRGGSFTASNQYNHYSLLRMVEDSLGLPTLTQNDRYAAPMNEFWDSATTSGAGSLV